MELIERKYTKGAISTGAVNITQVKNGKGFSYRLSFRKGIFVVGEKITIGTEKNRLYFIPSDKGFKVSEAYHSSRPIITVCQGGEKLKGFLGEYQKIKFDEKLKLWFIEREGK